MINPGMRPPFFFFELPQGQAGLSQKKRAPIPGTF